MRSSRGLKAVGRNVLRKDGVEKVSGAARYIDDLSFPNLLHARTIRSTIPSGHVVDIQYHGDTTGFTIVDYRDVPGRNIVALIDDDQPCLAEREIRHFAEPIVLLAHEDRERLNAVDVRIAYREATPNFDPAASKTSFKTIAIEKGSLDEGFAAADRQQTPAHGTEGADIFGALLVSAARPDYSDFGPLKSNGFSGER